MADNTLAHAFAHHVWATVQLLDACAGLSDEQLAQETTGVYGSIIDTLRHLVDADASYLSVIGGGPRTDASAMDVAGLRSVMESHAERWQKVVTGPIDGDRVVVRRRDDGSESRAPVSIRLAQAVHHGTDHRSQVCTALTTLGATPPEIDVWAYAWERDLLVETPPD